MFETIEKVTNIEKSKNKDGSRPMNIPTTIGIPEWLEYYLETETVPAVVDNKFLIKVGKTALEHKIGDVEDYNMAGLGGKKRIPEKLTFDDVAVIMMSIYSFKSIQVADNEKDSFLGVFVDNPNKKEHGTYSTHTYFLYSQMERVAPSFKNQDMDDVLDKIERSSPLVQLTKDKSLFPVNNGIFDQEKKELLPFDPSYVFLKKIPVDYNPNAHNAVITAKDGFNWDVESWIADLMDHDQDRATLIWQVIADCLQPNFSRKKSIWFYSEKGNNGKGTVGQLIKNLLGQGNYSSLSVDDFLHNFKKSALISATANIADENNPNTYIDDVTDYKATVTGDDIIIDRKYKEPLRMQFHGANIQMLNGLPRTQDTTASLYRRLILVPFLKSFTNNGERPYIKDDYIHRQDVLEHVLHKALHMDFDEYIIPEASAELLEEYKVNNNPVLEFWDEYKDEFVWDLLPNRFLYQGYVNWYKTTNPSGRVTSQRKFMDALLTVIDEQGGEWVEVKKVRPAGKMDDDEPLISEFDLDRSDHSGKATEWMDPEYHSRQQLTKVRNFERKTHYTGIERV